MLKQIVILFCIFILSFSTKAQNEAIITGYAPQFVGQKVSLYVYADYLTLSKIKIGEALVESDSLFKIENTTKQTVKAIVEIENTEAEIYLQEKSSYNIEYYKLKDQAVSFVNQKVQAVFYGLDSNDINYRILEYNNWFDTYIYYNQKQIKQTGFLSALDTFKVYAYEQYQNVNNPYFINYVRYNIANMEMSKINRDNKNGKQQAYMEYIRPYPVYAKNDQYMEYVKGYYPKDFESFSPHMKSSVFLSIDKSSPTRLMRALGKDPLLEKKELRELVMVNMLGNSYYKKGYNRQNLITILDSVRVFSKYKTNSVAAKNMLVYLTKLESGYPAPEINIEVATNEYLNWGNFEGKYIYVNFFANWNQTSLNEMKVIKDLELKHGENIEFVSFSTDKTRSEFDEFIKNNPEYKWNIVFLGENHELLERFNVKTIPAYYLIDQKGFIAQSPAKSPSPNGEYLSIDKTFYDINKRLHPKTQRNPNGSY
jgi:thiol-disulfide isomerase/thioredoxin